MRQTLQLELGMSGVLEISRKEVKLKESLNPWKLTFVQSQSTTRNGANFLRMKPMNPLEIEMT